MKKQNEASTPEEQNRKTAMRVSAVSIAWNVILSLFKLIAGIVGHSGAMIQTLCILPQMCSAPL